VLDPWNPMSGLSEFVDREVAALRLETMARKKEPSLDSFDTPSPRSIVDLDAAAAIPAAASGDGQPVASLSTRWWYFCVVATMGASC